MSLVLLVVFLLALLFISVWINTHEGTYDYSDESTPIADQLDKDFGVLESELELMETMSLDELLDYLRKRITK